MKAAVSDKRRADTAERKRYDMFSTRLMDCIDSCVEMERQLQAQPDAETAALSKEFVDAHLALADEFLRTSENEIRNLHLTQQQISSLVSEKNILPVFTARGEVSVVTFLSTFSCFWLSMENHEPMHSRRYMDNVKRVHRLVNKYYGKDPAAATGCHSD